MATLELEIQTHDDDLRAGSYAHLYIKLRNMREPLVWENFTGKNGLRSNSFTRRRREFPEIRDIDQIESFRVEHVSQESFGQTADNWDATISINVVSPIHLASTGKYRYQGDRRDRLFYPS